MEAHAARGAAFRSTRSGRTFSAWDVVAPAVPDFSFGALLANAVHIEQSWAAVGLCVPDNDDDGNNNSSATPAETTSPARPSSSPLSFARAPNGHTPSQAPALLARRTTHQTHGMPARLCATSPPSYAGPAQTLATVALPHAPATEAPMARARAPTAPGLAPIPLPAQEPPAPALSGLVSPGRMRGSIALSRTAGLAAEPRKGARKSKAVIKKEKEKGHRMREIRRQTDKLGNRPPLVKPSLIARRLRASSHLETLFDPQMKRVSAKAYIALRDRTDAGRERRAYALEEMVGEGSTYGFKLVRCRRGDTKLFMNRAGRIYAAICGQPNDKGWDGVHRGAAEKIKATREALKYSDGDEHHRRGDFVALPTGILYGNGMTEPGNASHSQRNAALLASLCKSEELVRISRFTASCLATWAPKLFQYYNENISTIIAQHPHLQPGFSGSPFACSTINFGPQTVSFDHTDNTNLSFGWCSVTPVGTFDYTRGGHLILWDLGLVVEFPAGSTALIPSAVLRHSNTLIQDGEERYSITQYTPGGLFRWAEHGFRSEAAFLRGLNARKRKLENERAASRWEKGMNMYSTLEELASKYK
ncbi:hypothetical protein HWV62_31945 [Athelia sp. TMB]|nr:hypothetical protein HWV62_31945 [Athelia sp. TMB]